MSEEDHIELKGAALLLGSLYWEGNETWQDGEKGKRRKKWRDARLHMETVRDLDGFPIRYGRRSGSRSGQFTIVLGGTPTGVIKMADLKERLPLDKHELALRGRIKLQREVEELAKAEGIWTSENRSHYGSWGLVAIAINPTSPFRDQIERCWETNFRPAQRFSPADYGEDLLDANGILKVDLASSGWAGIHFCLLTPTKPTLPAPSVAEIAQATKLGSYFSRNADAGIKTAADDAIREHLKGGV